MKNNRILVVNYFRILVVDRGGLTTISFTITSAGRINGRNISFCHGLIVRKPIPI